MIFKFYNNNKKKSKYGVWFFFFNFSRGYKILFKTLCELKKVYMNRLPRDSPNLWTKF